METDEDRPTIPSNTVLAALAADVGGMLETGISVIANAGHQIGVLFPMLPDAGEDEDPLARPRSPVADPDGCGMAFQLRQDYAGALALRIRQELDGENTMAAAPTSEVDEELAPDPQGLGTGG